MKSRRLSNSNLITVIAASLAAALFVSLLFIFIYPKIRIESPIKGITEYKTVELPSNSTSEYRFDCTMCGFDSMSFFIMGGDAASLTVSVRNTDKDTDVLKDVRITQAMCTSEGNGTVIKLLRPDSLRFDAGHYSVSISNASSSPANIVVEKEDGSLTVRLLVKTITGYIVFAAVCLMLMIFAVMTVCLYLKAGSTAVLAPEKLFLATVIPLSIACIFLIPPWSTGDSEGHYLACYRLSNLFLGQSGNAEWMGRTDDVLFFRDIWWNGTTPRTGAYEIVRSNMQLFASDKTLIEMTARSEKMNYYSVFCYIPQTAALVIGRLIGFGPIFNCYLVKVLTVVFYTVLCYRAIIKAPYCKGIIAFCAVMPSSLMMSGAFSYDPMVIIAALNFIASVLLLRESPDNNRSLAFASIWAFILGATKGGGYLLLLPLIFMVPARKKGLKHIGKFLPVICGLFSVAIFDMFLPDRGLYQFGSKGNGFMTASFALENPVTYLVMTVKTYGRFGGEMIADLFGSKLSWGEQTIPLLFSIVMLIALILLASSDERIDQLKKKDILFICIVVLISLLSTPAMLLSWTPEGSDVILGIQGHYFLPVLPLFTIAAAKGIRTLAGKMKIAGSKGFKAFCSTAYPVTLIMVFYAFYFIMQKYLTR